VPRTVPSLVAAAALVACVAAPPDVDLVLAGDGSDATRGEPASLLEAAARDQDELDARARAAVDAARAAEEDATLAIEAARTLFFAADLRAQRAVLAWVQAHEDATIDELLGCDRDVPGDAGPEVRSLSIEGLAHARRALGLRPNDIAARHYVGLHLSMIGWSEGPANAILKGRGPEVVRAMKATLELEGARDFEGAAPLRLLGRFRDRAPWPYGDRGAALELLADAVRRAPGVVNLVFLADASWRAGEAGEARALWRRALAAAPDPGSKRVAPLHRELIARRLAATDG
jgi:tetratricopeptide (TPR) repeat protein